jgi:hypothetical protein
MPVEWRAVNGSAKQRMFALGELSQRMKLKEDETLTQAYLNTWTELRHEGLSDEQIGNLFDTGKNASDKKPEKNITWVE